MIKPGIKRSVLIIAVLPAGAVALLLTLIFSISQIRNSEQSLTDRGFALARQLAPASEYGVYSRNPDILQPLIDSILFEQDVTAVEIRRLDGNLLIRGGQKSEALSGLDFASDTPSKIVASDNKSWFFLAPIFQTEFSDSLFDESTGAPENANLLRTEQALGTVVLELSLERIHAYQTKIWISSSLIAATVLLISALLAYRFGRSITDPVVELKTAVSDIESGNFDLQLDSGASGELLSLESGIKTMANSLKASREHLEERIEQSTFELRNTLAVLEQRNTELDTARSEAEAANDAKSQFLAKISHEFRTPLNGICGFLQLLKNSSPSATQHSYIQKIGTSTKALLELINEILDFSKIEVSEVQLKKSAFNLNSLLADCIDVSLPEAQEKGLKIEVVVDTDLPKEIVGDANRIAQIVRNLVSNAVKFTDDGEVVICAFKDTQAPSGRAMCISVTDTGIGILIEDQATLFEPFTQLESAKTRRHGGTGLGLAISKSLAELMGGSIAVGSITGEKGSCFTATLPFELVDESNSHSSDIESVQQKNQLNTLIQKYRNLRVLIADDNIINRQFLSTWLNQIGALVEEACDGQEAVQMCQNNNYDIIFMDLHMPVLDGLDAAKLIREDSSTPETTPIIAVTADVTEETTEQLSQSSLDDYLVKPVNENELIQKIEKWCTAFRARSLESSEAPKVSPHSEQSLVPIDKSLGVSLASGDEKLWKQSIKNLASQLEGQNMQLEEAFAARDLEKIKRLTHSIIGAASYCGALDLVRVSKELKEKANQLKTAEMENELQNLTLVIFQTQEWIKRSNL